jgi:hypothetical protein
MTMGKDEDLRPDIATAKSNMKSTLGSGKEIKRLITHLWDGETVERMLSGQYSGGMGLLTLTDRRLLFTVDGAMKTVSEDFPFSKISSIQWSGGMMMGSVVIHASGNKAEIKNVNKDQGKEFVDLVRGRLTEPSPGQSPTASAPTPGPDPMEQLRKLGELHQAGVLSDDEFNTKKAELLARM